MIKNELVCKKCNYRASKKYLDWSLWDIPIFKDKEENNKWNSLDFSKIKVEHLLNYLILKEYPKCEINHGLNL